MLDESIGAYYGEGRERRRLENGAGRLERLRTQELLRRYLPTPPAAVLDVGGGPGVYASWLAGEGYRVCLIDPVPLHVEQATALAASQPDHPFTAVLGDARRLAEMDGSWDAVLLMGPLYHLVERGDRLQALREACRVLLPGGVACATGISRFASLLDGLRMGVLTDERFAGMVEQDLQSGRHHNPDPQGHPEWFTTAFFHRPEELSAELTEAGLVLDALLGIEGPGWLLEERLRDPDQWESILRAARRVEAEPALLGLSAHLFAAGHRS